MARIMLAVVMLITILPGGSMVVCFGADGHRAIEPAHAGDTCGHGGQSDADFARSALCSADASCFDVMLDVSQPLTLRFDTSVLPGMSAILMPRLDASACDTVGMLAAPHNAKPRVADRLCLRSVVLVI